MTLLDLIGELAIYYGDPTASNDTMAYTIVHYIENAEAEGEDLIEIARVIKRVDRECWGGSTRDSEDEDSEGDY